MLNLMVKFVLEKGVRKEKVNDSINKIYIDIIKDESFD